MPLDILNTLCQSFTAVSQININNANLPAGDIFVVVGNEYDGQYRTTQSVSHPSFIGNAEKLTTYQYGVGSQYSTLEVWRAKSSGGSGTLQVSFNATTNFVSLWVIHATGIGSLLQDIRRTNFSWANTVQLTPTANGATHGMALMFGAMGTSDGSVSISPWNDETQQVDPGSWRDGRVSIRVSSSIPNQAVSFTGNNGISHIALCQLLVFPDAADASISALLGSRRL